LNYDSIRHAHNDWLEAYIEVGFIGEGLILTAFILYLVKIFRVWRNRRDKYVLGIVAGVMTGLISLGIHSFIDFNMHIPANPIMLAVILGIGYSAIHFHRFHKNGIIEKFNYSTIEITRNSCRQILLAFTAISILSIFILLSCRHLMAENICPTEWNSTLNLNWNPKTLAIKHAMELNHANAAYTHKLAWNYISARPSDKKSKMRQKKMQLNILKIQYALTHRMETLGMSLGLIILA